MKWLIALVLVGVICVVGCSVRYQKNSDGSTEVVIQKTDK